MIIKSLCVFVMLMAVMFMYAGYLLAVEANPGAFIMGLFGIGLVVEAIVEWPRE